MCGIAGLVDPAVTSHEALERSLASLVAPVAHRGPDGHGTWCDVVGPVGVALGHRRLAIVDLSPTGAQPMESPSGRYVMVTNGEIYDHRRWRAHFEAEGARFRGTSDTEVLLAAIDRWGLDEALRRVDGMFALAVWDRHRRQLSLARDRLGEKPLYVARVGRAVAFASRPGALRALPDAPAALSPDAVGAFLRFGFVPRPFGIFDGITPVGPGEVVEVSAESGEVALTSRTWWGLDEAVRAGRAPSSEVLEEAVRESVRLRLQADVPTGVLMSGGIDSTLVAAVAREVGGAGVKTFTVAVGSAALDESARAARIARHLGTDHTTIELGDADALAAVDHWVEAFDEPFGDPSALPTLMLCREVRRHVTVALGGDGGDELFAGYNRHVAGARAWTLAGRLPAPVRRAGGALLVRTPGAAAVAGARLVARVRRRESPPHLGDKLVKLGRLVAADRAAGPWAALAPAWPGALPWSNGAPPPDPVAPASMITPLDQLRWLDTATTLPDDMLVKLDRASMHWALETRCPLLAPDVVAWAWAQPPEALVAGNTGKLPLRRLLARLVPSELSAGPKRGFDPPLAAWLRGPLRAWAGERLAPDRLAATGWLEPEPVTRLWTQHLGGRANHDYRLWTVLSFVAWWERWGR